MNITFLVGNGFDLNLNLNTRYSDFYKYYIKNDPKDLLSKSIKDDYEMWSDLEVGLGEFLKNIDENQINEFLDSKSTLERILAEYLTLENQRIRFKDEKALAEEFRKKVLNFFSDFNALDKDHYHRVIGATREQINYNFITFNYTSVLDTIVAAVQKNKPFSNHSAGGRGYNDAVISTHHIHGKLTEDLILGLDNTEQILNDRLKSNPELTNYIIKSAVNTALGEKKIEKAKDIINKSKFICLFGLSIGDTDGMWWSYIIEWLKRDKDNRLVLFVNKNTNVQLSGQEKIRFRNLTRKMMLERSRCEISETQKLVQDKIIVVPNSKIFNLENIILEDKENG
ncbi:MAG: hypothetical protein E7408_05585 [Ruminococcaceae bacterium]|nr:hypothetical protein [Oscillospiraceae bacterium]